MTLLFILLFNFIVIPSLNTKYQVEASVPSAVLTAGGYALGYSLLPYILGGALATGATYLAMDIYNKSDVKAKIDNWYEGISASAKQTFNDVVDSLTGQARVDVNKELIQNLEAMSLYNAFNGINTDVLNPLYEKFSILNIDISRFSEKISLLNDVITADLDNEQCVFHNKVKVSVTHIDNGPLTQFRFYFYPIFTYFNSNGDSYLQNSTVNSYISNNCLFVPNNTPYVWGRTSGGSDYTNFYIGSNIENFYSYFEGTYSAEQYQDFVVYANKIFDFPISVDDILDITFPGSAENELILPNVQSLDIPAGSVSIPYNPEILEGEGSISLVPQAKDLIYEGEDVIINDIPFDDTIPIESNSDIPIEGNPPLDLTIPPIGVNPGELSLDFSPLLATGEMFTNKFPFSIPWDLKNSIQSLVVQGEAPTFTLPFKNMGVLGGRDVVLDFSIFEKWAIIIRWGLLIAFNVMLIFATRKLIGQ